MTSQVRLGNDGRFFVPVGAAYARLLGEDGELGEPVPIRGRFEEWSANYKSCQKRHKINVEKSRFDQW